MVANRQSKRGRCLQYLKINSLTDCKSSAATAKSFEIARNQPPGAAEIAGRQNTEYWGGGMGVKTKDLILQTLCQQDCWPINYVLRLISVRQVNALQFSPLPIDA